MGSEQHASEPHASSTGNKAEGVSPGLDDLLRASAAGSKLVSGVAADNRGAALLDAVGGIRGIAEAVVPGLIFVILFALTLDLIPSLIGSLAVGVAFTVVRLVTRSNVTQAIAGLLGAAASAGLALFTGRGEDNFVLGLLTNAGYALAFLISLCVRWPLIGLVVGYFMNDGTRWRRDRTKFRALFWVTVAWLGLFVARLVVQVPLYLAGDGGDTVVLLGTAKLLMGLPLYVPLLLLTWVIVRNVYAKDKAVSREIVPATAGGAAVTSGDAGAASADASTGAASAGAPNAAGASDPTTPTRVEETEPGDD